MIFSYAKGWARTLDINGKTNRKEFWAFVIIDLLVIIVTTTVFLWLFGDLNELETTSSLGIMLWGLHILINGPIASITRISILGRRIRDTGRNQKWMFCLLIPYLGWLILILLALQPSFSGTRDTLQVRVVENLNEKNSDIKTNENSLQSKLEELKTLKKEGLVSEEEYEKMRKNTLGL